MIGAIGNSGEWNGRLGKRSNNESGAKLMEKLPNR